MLTTIAAKINHIFNTEDKKRLFSNFLSLSVLQGANYILPLITLPYLARVLLPEYFGKFLFAQAIIQYFIIFIDYGFNLSAVREVAVAKNDKSRISTIFWNVQAVKVVFFVSAFFLLLLVLSLFPSLDKRLFLFLYAGVLGYVFTPIWFFQGLGKLKFLTIITAVSKLILLVLTFLFVKNREDYLIFALLNSFSFIFSGIIATYYISKHYPLKKSLVSFQEVKCQLKIGFPTFVSTIAYTLYSNTNIVLLGVLAGEKAVATFSVAKKLMDILTNLYSVLSKVVYPRVSELFFKSRDEALTLLKEIYIPVIFLIFVFVVILLIFPFISNLAIDILFGKEYIESAKVFRILSVSFLLLVVNNLINVQILLALGYNSTYGRIMTVTSIFSLIIGFVLIKYFGYIGLAYNFVITEVITLIQSLLFLQRRLRKIA